MAQNTAGATSSITTQGSRESLDSPTSEFCEFPFGKPPSLLPTTPFSPFRNNSRELDGCMFVVRSVIMFPIFLIRFSLFWLIILLGYFFTKIALLGASKDEKKPFPPWRRSLLWPLRLCARGILFVCGYHYIHVKGRCAERDVAPIIVGNHVTFADPVFTFFAHLPVIVNAKENLDLPIVGTIMKALQVIPVDREDPDSRKKTAGAIKRKANCNDWNHVVIFPEATTTNGRSLVSFKYGAFNPGFPVQPVLFKYPFIKIDPSWVSDGPPIYHLLFNLMTQFHNFMEVEYLPVIEPSIKEIKNPRLFAERTRRRMADALNVSLTEHSFDDVALIIEAEKLKMDKKIVNVEFSQFVKTFGLTLSRAKFFLKKYRQFDVSKDGTVSYEDFISSLHLKDNVYSRKLFNIFDIAESNSISFREYLAGVAFILRNKEFETAVNNVFKEIVSDSGAKLNPHEINEAFRFLLADLNDTIVEVITKDSELTGDAFSLKNLETYFGNNPEYLALILLRRPSLFSASPKNEALFAAQ